jgi:hypothetical protein
MQTDNAWYNKCGVVANLALNIVWVITIKCTGHNSHGSGCFSPNSQKDDLAKFGY